LAIDDEMFDDTLYCTCASEFPSHAVKLEATCAQASKKTGVLKRVEKSSTGREKEVLKKQGDKDEKTEIARRKALKTLQSKKEHVAQNEGEFAPWTKEQQEAYAILKANCTELRAARKLAQSELNDGLEKLHSTLTDELKSQRDHWAGKLKGNKEYREGKKRLETSAKDKAKDVNKEIDKCDEEKKRLPSEILRRKYETIPREQLQKDDLVIKKINKVITKHLDSLKQIETDKESAIAAILSALLEHDTQFLAQCGPDGTLYSKARLDETKLTQDSAVKEAKVGKIQDARLKKLSASVQSAVVQFKKSIKITELVEFCCAT